MSSLPPPRPDPSASVASAPPSVNPLLLLAGLSLLAWVTYALTNWDLVPPCPRELTLIRQAQAYGQGVPLWDFQALRAFNPTCEHGPIMFQPAVYAVLAPVADALEPLIVPWTPTLHLVAWIGTLVAAGWMFRRELDTWAWAAAAWMLMLGRPYQLNQQLANVTTLESVLLWGACAAMHAGRWSTATGLLLVLGAGKPVWWALLGVLLPARRWRELGAAVVLGGVWAGVPFVFDADHSWHLWRDMSDHDERGLIHPSLRSLVGDALGAPAWGSVASNLSWFLLSVAAALALWRWIARRGPDAAEHPDALALYVLTFLCVTPYLKDHTLLLAVPALAWVTVRAPLPGVALLVLAWLDPSLGGYGHLFQLALGAGLLAWVGARGGSEGGSAQQ